MHQPKLFNVWTHYAISICMLLLLFALVFFKKHSTTKKTVGFCGIWTRIIRVGRRWAYWPRDHHLDPTIGCVSHYVTEIEKVNLTTQNLATHKTHGNVSHLPHHSQSYIQNFSIKIWRKYLNFFRKETIKADICIRRKNGG